MVSPNIIFQKLFVNLFILEAEFAVRKEPEFENARKVKVNFPAGSV
jgi:hypothetical protein